MQYCRILLLLQIQSPGNSDCGVCKQTEGRADRRVELHAMLADSREGQLFPNHGIGHKARCHAGWDSPHRSPRSRPLAPSCLKGC